MSTPNRNLPRFLPTLTEVVVLATVEKMPVPATPSVEIEDTVKCVMQRLDGLIELRLREEFDAIFRNMMAEQLQGLGERLRQELECIVRQSVSEALSSQPDQHESK